MNLGDTKRLLTPLKTWEKKSGNFEDEKFFRFDGTYWLKPSAFWCNSGRKSKRIHILAELEAKPVPI